MKKISLLVLLSLIAACKMNQNDLSQNPTKGIGEINTDSEREFTSDEMKIIKDTCNKLASKREYFNTLDDMKVRFNFSLETSNCGLTTKNNVSLATVLSNTSSTDLEYYIADRTDYLRYVITDQSAGFKYLCDNKDEKKVKNTSNDGSTYYGYRVFINQGYNHIDMTKSVKDAKGAIVLKSADAIDFVTSTYQGPQKLLGIEKEHIRNIVCDNNRYYYIKQTWLNN